MRYVFNDYDMPDVEVPEDGLLTPEEWVVWFRMQPTGSQVAIATAVLEVSQHDFRQHTVPVPAFTWPEEVDADMLFIRDILTKTANELDKIVGIEDPNRKRHLARVVERMQVLSSAIRRVLG